MSFFSVFILILVMSGGTSLLAFRQALFLSHIRKAHSRAHYHAWFVFLLASIPSLAVLVLWTPLVSVFISLYIDTRLDSVFPDISFGNQDAIRNLILFSSPDTLVEDWKSFIGKGSFLSFSTQNPSPVLSLYQSVSLLVNEAEKWRYFFSYTFLFFLPLIFLCCAFYGFRQVTSDFRARDKVEKFILASLITALILAVLVMIGIFFLVLFYTLDFFQEISPLSFFFGLVWEPRFAPEGSSSAVSGQFGLLPLLAGTLYIALIALIFAVPLGLLCAIYMSEYVSPRTRSILKPALELLAGIPTIVYGIFALSVLGPFFRDLSAFLSGSYSFIEVQSVFTAGFIMGLMLIPVVCSLSDDIISAVPSMMRDGSLALGATHSETIRNVVLPAALPGIGGAILLAASRAVGETMIVVLAAGVAPNLTGNPFEAMTTITVKIVSQLTGDSEFDSPQTQVAFALAFTLFGFTFLMNILSLFLVRKYHRRYE